MMDKEWAIKEANRICMDAFRGWFGTQSLNLEREIAAALLEAKAAGVYVARCTGTNSHVSHLRAEAQEVRDGR